MARDPRTAPLSVVIPVYQGERYLGEAVESLLAQTRVPHQILVVDDGSTDRSAEVAASFGERVELLRQPNRGNATARNNGIAHSTQPYVAFLDADDVATADRVESQLALLEGAEPPDIVFGRMIQFVSPDVPADVASRLQCDERAQPSPLPSCFMATRATCDKLGPMRTDVEATFVDWYMRALDLDLRIEFPSAVVARRRLHGANQSYRNERVRSEYVRIVKASLDRRRAKVRSERGA